MLVYPLHALLKRAFIEPVQIRVMDLEPPEPGLAEGLELAELEQPAGEVVADVVEVRRDGVRAPAEVDVVWLVECVAEELAVYMYD